jgi:hypothetical protein
MVIVRPTNVFWPYGVKQDFFWSKSWPELGDLPDPPADAPPVGMGQPPDHVDWAVRLGVIQSYRLVAPEVAEKSCKFTMQKSFVTWPKTWRDILVPCWRDRPEAPLL